jgi:hypothetical protein
MAYKLEIREKVRSGTLAGFLWYEEKSEGLGSRFVAEVEKMIEYVAQNPLHFQVKYKDYREAIMKKFPYVIIYQVKNDLIILSSVFPCKNDPERKLK